MLRSRFGRQLSWSSKALSLCVRARNVSTSVSCSQRAAAVADMDGQHAATVMAGQSQEAAKPFSDIPGEQI